MISRSSIVMLLLLAQVLLVTPSLYSQTSEYSQTSGHIQTSEHLQVSENGRTSNYSLPLNSLTNEADSISVLKYIVSTTKDSIFSMGKEMYGTPEMTYEEFFQPENVAGMCELAEAVVIFICDDLGLSRSATIRFQGTSCLGGKAVRHASVILTLPDGNTYLIDPTFGQFLDENFTEPNQIGYPGVLLSETLAGRRLSSKLVYDGWVEFDDDAANIYGKVLSRSPEVSDYDIQFFKDNDEGFFPLTRFIISSHGWPSPPLHLVYTDKTKP